MPWKWALLRKILLFPQSETNLILASTSFQQEFFLTWKGAKFLSRRCNVHYPQQLNKKFFTLSPHVRCWSMCYFVFKDCISQNIHMHNLQITSSLNLHRSQDLMAYNECRKLCHQISHVQIKNYWPQNWPLWNTELIVASLDCFSLIWTYCFPLV